MSVIRYLGRAYQRMTLAYSAGWQWTRLPR